MLDPRFLGYWEGVEPALSVRLSAYRRRAVHCVTELSAHCNFSPHRECPVN